jgi:hypothetical protein
LGKDTKTAGIKRTIQGRSLEGENLILRIRHLNIDKAIERFLANVESLNHLPFVRDEDMVQLYGEEVAESLVELTHYNNRAKTCQECSDKCCRLVNCELYHPVFSQCPIFPFRPAICRMHFCEKFPVGDISFIREFADIFLNGLIEARRRGSEKALLFDCPPLSKQVPGIVAAVLPWMNAVKEGQLNEASARALIFAEVERYYQPAPSNSGG